MSTSTTPPVEQAHHALAGAEAHLADLQRRCAVEPGTAPLPAGFAPRMFSSVAAEAAYLSRLARVLGSPAVDAYLDGGHQAIGRALRAGRRTVDVAQMDAAMRPLPDDLVLSCSLPGNALGADGPAAIRGRVAAYRSYLAMAPARPLRLAQPGDMLLDLAVPTGTPAAVSGRHGVILLARNTELVVTRVVGWTDMNGWDVYAAVLPGAEQLAAADRAARLARAQYAAAAAGVGQ